MHRSAAPSRSFPPESTKGGSGNIQVVVRVRPPNESEISGNYTPIVRVLDEHVLIFDPKEDISADFFHGKKRCGRDMTRRKNRDVRFAFDYVFDCDSQNKAVFENTTKLILDGFLDGYNCAVFAYGATGAGKTFTMLGNHNTHGVILLTMMDLYERIEKMKAEKTCEVAVSYLEVYNEQIADLLVPKGYLPVREDPQVGVVIPGLSLHKPKDAKELLNMLLYGNGNRSQHPTDANSESSRSHAVFQVFVRQRDRTANISANVRIAKMSLIDLAGSERAVVTKNRGARFREGANINKSLLALGNCINALAEGKSKGYIPYRNSKLTRLLKDSLGGNCQTIMIAAVSPSAKSYEDTYNTLCYANRAKNIKAQLKRNVVNVDFHISKYVKIVDELREEVCELKSRLKVYEDTANLPSQVPVRNPELNRLSGELQVLFEDRRNIRQEILELEGKERDLAVRLDIKEKCLLRVKAICVQFDEKAASKISHAIETIKRKQDRVLGCKQRVLLRMEQNLALGKQLEEKIQNMNNDGIDTEFLECQLKMLHQEVELTDTKRHVRCLQNICRLQQNHISSTEKLVLALLQAYKQVYFTLKGHQLATNDLTSQYDNIQHQVEGDREVAWADQSLCDRQPSPDLDKLLLNHLLNFPVQRSDGETNLASSPFKAVCQAKQQLLMPASVNGFCLPSPGVSLGTQPLPQYSSSQSVTQIPPQSMVQSQVLAQEAMPAAQNTTCTEQYAPPMALSTVSAVQNVYPTLQSVTPVVKSTQITTQYPISSTVPTVQSTVPTAGGAFPTTVTTTQYAVSTTQSSETNDNLMSTTLTPASTIFRVQATPGPLWHTQISSGTPQRIPCKIPTIQPSAHTTLYTPQRVPNTQQNMQCSERKVLYTPQRIPQTPQLSQLTAQSTTFSPQLSQLKCTSFTPQRVRRLSGRLTPQRASCAQSTSRTTNSTVSQAMTPSTHRELTFPPTTTTVGPSEPTASQLSPLVLTHTKSLEKSLMDGIAPLVASPETDQPPVTVESTTAVSQVQTPHRPTPMESCQTMKLAHQPSASQVPVINSGTVTKPARIPFNPATVTKSTVDSSTVVKQAPTISTIDYEGLATVKRVMTFSEDTNSPSARPMTFADAVKSPAPAVKQQHTAGLVNRSPLASRENIMEHQGIKDQRSNVASDKNRYHRQLSRSKSASALHSDTAKRSGVSNTQHYLQRVGLPSAVAMKSSKNVPQNNGENSKRRALSRSSSVKNFKYQRSASSSTSDVCQPKRQKIEEKKEGPALRLFCHQKKGSKLQQKNQRPAFI